MGRSRGNTDKLPRMSAGQTVLEYASSQTPREPWGPLFFRPSRRSLLLMLLCAAAAAWLSARHHPWRAVATIPSDYHVSTPFTADNQLLVFDTARGVNLFDPATGTPIRTVLAKLDAGAYRYFVLKNGEQILALPQNGRAGGMRYDTASGRGTAFTCPAGAIWQLGAVAPDSPRIIAGDVQNTWRDARRGTRAVLWDLLPPAPATQPTAIMTYGQLSEFSPDGKRILQLSKRDSSALVLLDSHADLIGWLDDFRDGPNFRCAFVNSNYFWLWDGTTNPFEIRSANSGELVRSIALPIAGGGSTSYAVSDDAALLGLLSRTMRQGSLNLSGPQLIFGPIHLQIHDTLTGAVVSSRPCSQWSMTFFRHSHHLLAGDRDLDCIAIIDPSHSQPLAVLPRPGNEHFELDPVISPDGQTIATAADSKYMQVAIYRRTGADCPESSLGALAFPQTWLTMVFFASLVLSLLRDTRRARLASVLRPPPASVQNALILFSLIFSLHFILTACLGRLILTPAPLMLLAGIGLATHGRAWRMITFLVFSGMLPLTIFVAHSVNKLGLKSTSRYPLLDRFYDIPNVLGFVGLCGLAALLLGGILLLASGAVSPSRHRQE
jgi:hypothetical protein